MAVKAEKHGDCEKQKINNSTESSKHFYQMLYCFDILFATFVVCPMVIGSWRGLWSLLDYYEVQTLHSLITGASLQLFLLLFKDAFLRICTPKILSTTGFFIVSRLYTCISGFSCISFWRGVWHYIDEYPGMEYPGVNSENAAILTAYMTGASIFMLFILKRLSNLDLPVFSVRVDTQQTLFSVPTMYRIQLVCNKTCFKYAWCAQMKEYTSRKLSV